jgi:hypothetical protein
MEMVKETVKDLMKTAATNLVGQVCGEVARAFHDKALEPNWKTIATSIDPTGIANAVQKCKSSKGRMCTKAVLESVSNFDPTGVIGLAAAFLHPQCIKLPEVINCFESSVG